MKPLRTFEFLFLSFTIAFGVTLQEVFDSSGPDQGYDRYVILDENSVYEGGIGIYEGSVYIDGQGSVVELNGGNGIWVFADAQTPATLDIDHVTIRNGGFYALNFSGTAQGSVTNCNIINSNMGVQLLDTVSVTIRNCNLIENETYGLAVFGVWPVVTVSYCNAWNNGDDYMENCPG